MFAFPVAQSGEGLRRQLSNPRLFRAYLLAKLPLAAFAGLKIREIGLDRCSVSVPYGWRTQNPFRSIYFAAQTMAAELSTGALAMVAVQGAGVPISMLLTSLQASFDKKGDRLTTFTCEDGAKLREAVSEAVRTQEGTTAVVESVGRKPDGTVTARFTITWSFKRKDGSSEAKH